MRRVIVLSTALLLAIAAAGVQGAAAQSIDPGMTKSQVIERLGAPAAERSSGRRLPQRSACWAQSHT